MTDSLTPEMRRGINIPRLLSRAPLLALCIAATGLSQQLERILPLRTGRGAGATTRPHSLVLNPGRNVLYCLGMTGWVVVYDCATDSVIKDLPVPRAFGTSYYPATPALWDCRNNRACFVTDAGLAIVDGATDSITAVMPIGSGLNRMAYDSSQARVAVTDPGSCRVLLVDAGTCTVAETLHTTRPPQTVAWDPGTNRYYVLQSLSPGYEGFLTVFDAGSGATLDSFPLAERCERWPVIVCAPGAGKLYLMLDSVVLAVDARSNRVVRRLARPWRGFVITRSATGFTASATQSGA